MGIKLLTKGTGPPVVEVKSGHLTLMMHISTFYIPVRAKLNIRLGRR